MKKIIALLLGVLMAISLCACNMNTTPAETTSSASLEETTSQVAIEAPAMVPAKEPDMVAEDDTPVSILELAKEEVHDALFREQNETTLKIVNRLFKNMEYIVVDSCVDGDEAVVTMWVMNINAGNAWVRTLEGYAALSVENMLTEKQMTSKELYETYLEELEDSFKAADMVIIPVVVEMEFENYQWVWDFDDDVINAITGNLLAAIEGDLNDYCNYTITPNNLEQWVWDLSEVLAMFERAMVMLPGEHGYITLDPECLPTN